MLAPARAWQERTRHLAERLNLTLEIHDSVIPELSAISLALKEDAGLPPFAREMYAESIADALCNLRALLASARRAPRGTQESLCEAVERLRRRHPQLSIVTRGCERRVPAKLDELAGHFLAEGLRNAAKHARPSEVEVRAETTEATLVIEIFNDGVRGERASGGLGLRLLTLHALEHGAIAVFGMSDKATWRARLVAPLGGA